MGNTETGYRQRLENRYESELRFFEEAKSAAIEKLQEMTLEQAYNVGMVKLAGVERINAIVVRAMTLKDQMQQYDMCCAGKEKD